MATISVSRNVPSEQTSLVQRLFTDRRAALLWLPIRVWLGLQWLEAGSHKITEAAWMDGGVALKGFWTNAVSIPEGGRPPIAFDWYRSFLQTLLDAEAYTWFAKLIAVGEVMIGIALIVGALVGVAAFFGAFMNWNFMMAGSASTNPLLFVIAIALLLAWRVSGYIGLDYVLFNARRIRDRIVTRRDSLPSEA
ncbi:MAG: DoxX family membrane protein [Anaerolineae bacterium]|jgi:thiosulfate dehydrogenase [quinone] large subunit|nr:DoxX family membrane protein [Anaerolineae bacterium]